MSIANHTPTSAVSASMSIAVIGAGTMGRGIAQLFAVAGHEIRLHDAVDGAAAKAVDFVLGMIGKSVEKGRLTQDAFARIRGRVTSAATLQDLAGCDLVIEAIVEDVEIKRKLFAELESVVGDSAILASNTSSLSVAEIAAACKVQQRVAGLHFFNPVPLMKVAEVIAAARTSRGTIETLVTLVQGAGHRAVVCADQPGFLVNHAGRGLYTEGLRILEEQVASHVDVDTILREAAGFRMGPFELLDLTGLDVSSKVMASIYEQFQQEPRFRPSSLVPPRVAAGLYGRKTGEGWYRYEGGKQVAIAKRPLPSLASGIRVWIDPNASDREALERMVSDAGGTTGPANDARSLLVVQPWGVDATAYCLEHRLDASRCVAIDPLPGLARHRTLMLTCVTAPAHRDVALALFANDGTPVTTINDSPGFVVQRVLATIVNIGANIAQRGIASVADIEAAVQVGLGYPKGPLAWGDEIGASRVLTILRNMQAQTGDPRYRPSAWLVRRAGLGLPLSTPEAARQ
jgi:3-hydroxybutyryl-CoA dehydrogenase